jgi:hypothetical protein
VTPSPSRLEYGVGLDIAASWLEGAPYPLLAVVSQPEMVDLVLARVAGPVVFACEGGATFDHAARRIAGGDVAPEVARGSRALAAEAVEQAGPLLPAPPGDRWSPAGPASAAALWASPQGDTWPNRLTSIERVLDGGRLCVFTGTGVSAVTGRLRAGRRAGAPAPLESRLRARMAGAGWRLERRRGLGGAAAGAWAVVARLAALSGRADLADRAERAHHLAVEDGTGASYALLLATRGGGAAPAAPGGAP